MLLDLTRLGWGRRTTRSCRSGPLLQPGGTLEHCARGATAARRRPPRRRRCACCEIGWSADVREAARKIKCPVLVVHPERDVVVPIDEGRLIASLIPDCRFVKLDSENHMPLAEEPAWARLSTRCGAFLAWAAPRAPPTARIAARPSSRRVSARCSRASQAGSTILRSPRAEIVGEDRAQPHHAGVRQDRGRAPLPGDRAGARSRALAARRSLSRDSCPAFSREKSQRSEASPQYSGAAAPLASGQVTHRAWPQPEGNPCRNSSSNESSTGAGKLPRQELQAISQKSCGVLREMGPQIQWHAELRHRRQDLLRLHRARRRGGAKHARKGGFPANRIARVRAVIDPTTAE